MTEKRFTQKDEDDWEILDRNKHFAYAHSGYQAGKIIRELNELVKTNRKLYKENKLLKKQLLSIDDDMDYYKSKASNLEDGYIQLQNKEILSKEENEHYKALFFEIVETALSDKNCRELYCRGILDIFDKANSLNQAREMIKARLEE